MKSFITTIKESIKNLISDKTKVLRLTLLFSVALIICVNLLISFYHRQLSPKKTAIINPSETSISDYYINTNGLVDKKEALNSDFIIQPGMNAPEGSSYKLTGPFTGMNLTITITSKDFMTLADQIINRCYHYTSDSIIPGIDISTLDKCYKLHINYNQNTPSSDYYLYQQNGIPYIQSVKVNQRMMVPLKDYGTLFSLLIDDGTVSTDVDKDLSIILTSLSKNGKDSDCKQNYEDILHHGDNALYYMLSLFYKGEGNTAKGTIMMYLCDDILGNRCDKKADDISPIEWYQNLYIKPETVLPDFTYQGNDKLLKLVYETETQIRHDDDMGFVIVTPHVFGYYEEGNQLKILLTTLYDYYKLYENTLIYTGGGVASSAMNFHKEKDNSYTLEKYEQASDGSYFNATIEDFCVMPHSGKKIPGLANKILDFNSNYSDLLTLRDENLKTYLKSQGLENVLQKTYSYLLD